ncbi:hypothetical protein [Lentzea sp. NPDC059081]|uniref:hypothetical protein n=1 Tax=Lentzea sp. NPDC059081 TaxID=3346719 RepID=UPI0036CCF969
MSVDACCERLGPGRWAEAPPSLLALVGLASLSFPTLATQLTGALDGCGAGS